jgi:hypothetical protein
MRKFSIFHRAFLGITAPRAAVILPTIHVVSRLSDHPRIAAAAAHAAVWRLSTPHAVTVCDREIRPCGHRLIVVIDDEMPNAVDTGFIVCNEPGTIPIDRRILFSCFPFKRFDRDIHLAFQLNTHAQSTRHSRAHFRAKLCQDARQPAK